MICNVLLINNSRHTLGRVCSAGDSSYIFHDDENNDVADLGAVSLQCGRRVDSLKWFLDWKFFGKEGFAERVENSFNLCRYAEEKVLESDDFELVFPRNSFNVCFRYRVDGDAEDGINIAIRENLYRRGISLVGYAYHCNRPFLRLLLASFDITRQDVDRFFDQIRQTAKALEVESS